MGVMVFANFLVYGKAFDKRNWEIRYSSFDGVEARAVEFLYGELGNRILRDPGSYVLHTLKCEKISEKLPESNAFIIGEWGKNPLLQRFIDKDEIPANGFRIRIVNNPESADHQLVLIAGDDPAAVLYGVVTCVDDILPAMAPDIGSSIRFWDNIFERSLKPCDYADAPQTLVRSVFTWGHPIGNFREYFKNMARLKINRVYLWNDYPPLNAQEIVDFAHSWGIEIFWGYAWGWSTDCAASDLADLNKLSDEIYAKYRDVWSKLPGDGIYFQSFTELRSDKINGKSVAENVIQLVNMTARRILQDKPDLKIVFGLHATSVKKDLPAIAQTDPRLEILWEDCGGFPYYNLLSEDTAKDDEFVQSLIDMKRDMGLVFKAQLMQQWVGGFVHQKGSYIMGCNGEKMHQHDVDITTPFWREYSALWHRNAPRAYQVAKDIHAVSKHIELNLAAQLNGPVNFPTAFVAEIFWSTNKSCADIIDIILRRSYVRK